MEIVKAKFTPEQFKGAMMFQVLKYTFRHEYKGKPAQDLDKCAFYLKELRGLYKDDLPKLQ